jgi:hypothetical protein
MKNLRPLLPLLLILLIISCKKNSDSKSSYSAGSSVTLNLTASGKIAGASYTNETQSWVVLNLGYNIDSLPSTWSTSFKTTENSQIILLSATAVSGDISGTISVNGQVKKQATGHSIGLAYP